MNGVAISSKTIFILLFLGVIITVITQGGMITYLFAKEIAIVLPIPWYYYVAFIVGVLYIGILGTIMIERNKLMKISFGLLLLSAVLLLLNPWWFLSSPFLWIGSLVISSILTGIAWYILRHTTCKTIQVKSFHKNFMVFEVRYA